MTIPLATRLLSAAAVATFLVHPGLAQEVDAPEPPSLEEPEADAPDAPEPEVQETEAPETDAPEAEAPSAGEAAASPDDPSADDPAEGAAPTEPEVLEIVRETHGDWEVRCLPDGNDCFLYQLALDETENPVAEFSMVRLPAGGEATAGVTVVTPLGTLLPAGLVLQIDSAQARQYDFTFCSQVGCFARFGLAEDAIAAMKRGRSGRLQLVSIGAPEQPVSLGLSLIGFTAAYDSLEVPTAPAE